MVEISVLNYGVANCGSILNMLKKIGVGARLISTPEEVLHAEKLILPGVGAFDTGMAALKMDGLDEAIIEVAKGKSIPVLGICLGMQLLCDGSDEGERPGLGLIAGRCQRIVLPPDSKLKIPHMGWGFLANVKADPLFAGFEERVRFYFVHAYHMLPANEDALIAEVSYQQNLAAVVKSQRIYGVQFHPEKSHRFGMQLLKNFTDL